jgi:putative PIN family toxin of toxin-antitoxin system
VKVFLDTNVLVSAFTARGLCADLVRLLLAEHELMTGEVNLVELRRVLVDRFGASAAIAASVESQLRDQIVITRPQVPSALPIRDADDAWVLASALSSDAEMLVTGDQDLLSVAALVSLPIVTPRAAWEQLRGP